MNDKDLIAGVVDQKIEYLKLLFEKYHKNMFRVAMRYLSHKEDAEDVLTETFIRVHNNIHNFKFNGEGSVGKWIKTIVINESLRMLGKHKRLIYKEDLNEADIIIDEDFDGTIDMGYLLSLVQSMPDGYKIVFNLYAVENFSHKQISELLGISVSTSKSQLYKARKYLILQLKKMRVYEMGRD